MSTAKTIVMVKPVDFCFNEQTARDNEFMSSEIDAMTANSKALKEFENAVEIVKKTGVNVIEFDKSKFQEFQNINIPDAVFPNNWFSTDIDGSVILYPMLAKNRDAEKQQFSYIAEQLTEQFNINRIINFSHNQQILEGTGSLIFDRVKQRVYCSLSQRAEPEIFEKLGKERNYDTVGFESKSSTGIPYYHTNVILSIGEKFAVFCAECIEDVEERERIVKLLSEDRELVLIDKQQVEKFFCGNILELESNNDGTKQIFMSQSAYNGFRPDQMEILQKHGNVVGIPLDTIEEVGGGSMRCMMAEIFLQDK